MHHGNVMMKLAQNYSNLQAVIAEIVQNALDSDASKITIAINMRQREVNVYDNGSGADDEKITLALQSIGNSLKTKVEDEKNRRFGQFGLGLISPISVCREFNFTTCPIARKDRYTTYSFVVKDIAQQEKVSIPSHVEADLQLNPDGKIWWRTRVEMRGVTKDRRASYIELEELHNDIVVKFGEEIRRRNTKIDIILIKADGSKSEKTVTAPEFSGQKLDIFERVGAESGTVKVELYLAQLTRGGRKGTITLGTFTNPSRISMKQFIDCTQKLLEPKVASALASGIFEGRILCQKVLLHTDRTRFENNDALFALCEVLESWYKKVGEKLIADEKEATSNNRFQKIGIQVMPYAETLLKQNSFIPVAQQISVGTVGTGHSKVPKKVVIGTDEGKSLSVDGLPFEGKDQDKKGGNGTSTNGTSTENPKHTPGIVYGVRGKKRTEVRGSSTGLRFEYIEMEDFRIPFEYDADTGCISFNIRHPDWGLCQEEDTFLQSYHIIVITTALSVELFRGHNGNIDPNILKFAHDSLSHQTFAILNGKALLATQAAR